MKAISIIGQILAALFFANFATAFFPNGAIVPGILILFAAFSVSPLLSMLLMKFGVYVPGKRTRIKTVLTALFCIAAFAILPSKPYSEEKEATNAHVIAEHPNDNVIKEPEPVKYTPVIDRDKLKGIQKKWADSMVKDWKGAYIKRYTLSPSLDTIYFQLSKEGTTGHWQETAHANEVSFQEDYNNVIARKSANEFSSIKTLIVLIPDAQQQGENEAKVERRRSINRQFSAWDGSNPFLENYIKQNMNDPGSYEHIETTYTDKGSYILVYTTFRGKNAFGAKVINHVKAKMDLEGNVLSMASQD